jgi:D-alanine-D-alanine ligase
VLPGLTETSLVPMALESAGYELGMFYAALAEKAVADHRR